jgi:hypothetical protein
VYIVLKSRHLADYIEDAQFVADLLLDMHLTRSTQLHNSIELFILFILLFLTLSLTGWINWLKTFLMDNMSQKKTLSKNIKKYYYHAG